MQALVYIRAGIDKLLSLAGILSGLMIAGICIIVTLGTVFRYFFLPSYWVEPYAVYMFIAASFFGAAYAMQKKEHVKVDILIRNFSPRVRKVLEAGTSLLALVFFVYLTWRSGVMVMFDYRGGTRDLSLLQIHVWIPKSFAALGALLLSLSLVSHLIGLLVDPAADEKPDEFNRQ
jgi:TRAP-type C4-dicarboxylate transport system permease small subunit